MRPEVLRQRRTWTHGETGSSSWRPMFVQPLACGCWWDSMTARMWEPCMAHESEGHVSAVSVYVNGGAAWRCLVPDCTAGSEVFTESQAVGESQVHWVETRRSEAQSGQ